MDLPLIKKSRATTLAATLMFCFLASVVAFATITCFLTRNRLLEQSQARVEARQAATSLLQRLCARWQTAPGTAEDQVLELGDARASVYFQPSPARPERLPLSGNNLAGLRATTISDGSRIPPATARVYCLGECRGARLLLVGNICAAQYPFALACQGSIQAAGDLTVAGSAQLEETAIEALLANPSTLGSPAHILSNSRDDGIHCQGNRVYLCGDVVTSGIIDLQGNPLRVLGQLREHSPPRLLPSIPVSQFDPLLTETGCDQLTGGNLPEANFLRRTRVQGSLRVNGDLEIHQTLLFVDGRLTVQGKLLGSGLVVTTGDLDLGSAQLQTSGRVALVSGGDLSLRGQGMAQSKLRGLVYSQGRVQASQLTLVGCLVSRGSTNSVTDLAIIHDPTPVLWGQRPTLPARIRISSSTKRGVIGVPSGFLDRQGDMSVTPTQPNHVRITLQPAEGERVSTEVRLDQPASLQAACDWLIQTIGYAGVPYAPPAFSATRGPLASGPEQIPMTPLTPASLPLILNSVGSMVAQNPTTGESESFDLSQFIPLGDRLRLTSLRFQND